MCIYHSGVHHMCAKVRLARLSGNLKCSVFQVHIFTSGRPRRGQQDDGGVHPTKVSANCKVDGRIEDEGKVSSWQRKEDHNRIN